MKRWQEQLATGRLLLDWHGETPRRAMGFRPSDRRGSPKPLSERHPIFAPNESHLLTVAPTGAGKGRSTIIPTLLTYPGAAVVVDPKGDRINPVEVWRSTEKCLELAAQEIKDLIFARVGRSEEISRLIPHRKPAALAAGPVPRRPLVVIHFMQNRPPLCPPIPQKSSSTSGIRQEEHAKRNGRLFKPFPRPPFSRKPALHEAERAFALRTWEVFSTPRHALR